MRACVIGANGQDGSILTEKLLDKNIQTHCLTRENINLNDRTQVKEIFSHIKPTHVFYLAAAHGSSTEMNKIPKSKILSVNYEGLKNVVSCLDSLNLRPWIFYPLSSKLYKNNSIVTENSVPNVECFYGESKVLAKEFMLSNYDPVCTCLPILFNHESKFRNSTFLSKTLVDFFSNKTKKLEVRYPNDNVDWGLASEFCDVYLELAMKNFFGTLVIATGKATKITTMLRTLCERYSKDFEQIDLQNIDLTERGVYSDITYLRKIVETPPQTHGSGVIDFMISEVNEF